MSAGSPPSPRIPLATYRLPLGPGLGFDAAAALVPYSSITWFVTIPRRTETDPERLAARKAVGACPASFPAALLGAEAA